MLGQWTKLNTVTLINHRTLTSAYSTVRHPNPVTITHVLSISMNGFLCSMCLCENNVFFHHYVCPGDGLAAYELLLSHSGTCKLERWPLVMKRRNVFFCIIFFSISIFVYLFFFGEKEQSMFVDVFRTFCVREKQAKQTNQTWKEF